MTEGERRAVAWIMRPGAGDPRRQDPCSEEEGTAFAGRKGSCGVEWALDEWKEACEEWRDGYRYKRVGIDENRGEGHGVWAVDYDGVAIDTKYFEDYRDAYARWKQLWKELR